jgi:cupin fold WbuC family metalloprotein
VKGASYEYTPLADKGRISFGSSVIEIVHSPLHTPGSTSFLMDGILLFTGDTIMKESIGRSDLGVMSEQCARDLYNTLFKRYAKLGNDIIVLPSHSAGKQIENALLDELTGKAKDSPRKRMNFNLHDALSDPLQRLCNAIEPETYIRPHRHADPDTCEFFVMLKGSAVFLFFNEIGLVIDRSLLSAGGPVLAAEIPPKTWHSMAALESGTVFFEVKEGPYVRPSGLHVAEWAPDEGEPQAANVVSRNKAARVGERLIPIEKIS